MVSCPDSRTRPARVSLETGSWLWLVPGAECRAISILKALKPLSFRLRQNRETVASAVPHSSASWVMDMNCTWECWAST